MAESFGERRAAGRRAPGRIEHAIVDDPKVIPLRRESQRAIIARSGGARGVIAVFDDPGALQAAIKMLESNGFDRSQIRLLAPRDVLGHGLADCFARSDGQADERAFQAPLDRMALPNALSMMVTQAAGGLGGLVRDDVAAHLQAQISRGRILVWVSLPRPEREATAREILARHALDVRASMS